MGVSGFRVSGLGVPGFGLRVFMFAASRIQDFRFESFGFKVLLQAAVTYLRRRFLNDLCRESDSTEKALYASLSWQ